ncbi:MAG: helix-turn-helix domain-containing protein [Saprospiraceae bacterium]|nr:helix-turn-helix domain-containing protein [Saprospiraceae bacterium]
MHVSIIVPATNGTVVSIASPYKILSAVNQYLIETGQEKEPFFEVDLVGIEKESTYYNGLFTIRPTKMIDEVDKTDLIIITSVIWENGAGLEKNTPFIPRIRKMHLENKAVLASICPGSFLIAKSGLVDGTGCSTHWAFANTFQEMFPKVNLAPHRILTEYSGIYTSGGSHSGMTLLVHLIEKYCGRNTGNWTSKMFELEVDRGSQSPFNIFQGQRNHEDILIKEVQDFIENNYQKKWQLNDLSKKFNLSKRNLLRRFKKATHNTPIQYLQRVKMEAAKRDLEQTNHSISEIMTGTGYNDVKAFRQTFKKMVGISPSTYRSKYGRSKGGPLAKEIKDTKNG